MAYVVLSDASTTEGGFDWVHDLWRDGFSACGGREGPGISTHSSAVLGYRRVDDTLAACL